MKKLKMKAKEKFHESNFPHGAKIATLIVSNAKMVESK